MPPEKLVRIRTLEADEADGVERRGDAVALGRAHPPGDAERQLDIGGDRAPRHQGRVLKHKADMPAGTAFPDWPPRWSSQLPPVGSLRPATMRSSVLLPHPDGPRRLRNSPRHREIDPAKRLQPRGKALGRPPQHDHGGATAVGSLRQDLAPAPSFPRKRESRASDVRSPWIPAFAG